VLEADAGHFETALAHVDTLLQVEPDQPLGLLFRARLERQLGRESDAEATWQQLVSEQPAFADSVARQDGGY
jgi:Tfp pilus assembly protein PilF